MSIGKILTLTGAVIGITIGTTMGCRILEKQDKEFQVVQQQCTDRYYKSAFDPEKGKSFVKEFRNVEKQIDDAANAFIPHNQHSAPNIFAKSYMRNGRLYLYNCTQSDIEKLTKAFQVTPTEHKCKLLKKIDEKSYTLHHPKTAPNVISFALADIKEPTILEAYIQGQIKIHRELFSYFPDSKINYNNKWRFFEIEPDKNANIFAKDVAMFFPYDITKKGADISTFRKMNNSLFNIFIDYTKPIHKTIKIPYEFVVESLCKGIKRIK